MLPIFFPWPKSSRKHQLSPATSVAFVLDHPRSSFDTVAEGGFPLFVLEVVSPSSTERDEVEKREAYELLKVREYALFTPRQDAPSRLEGYRLGPDDRFTPWLPNATGRLWSETLGLFLVTNGALVQAQTPDGQLLLNPEQTGVALREAEEELVTLRRELARLRGEAEE